ncbi:MAG: bifunctional 3,4-dihydroxy-2-butanone-4-phosphate synthase/GTP cyclohydrolase II [Legionellales bacterium]|nr:bifunctional 3,4-dihydroxy-2-butanone-4-phosphate synthase/GTP cyclohydrolase II [Legionellales bacterium]
MSNSLATIEQAIEDIRQGKMIILVDDENRENEGDLCMAADLVTPEAVNFMAKYARGLICLPMTADAIDRLQLPMMVKRNGSKHGTAFTASIEAATGVTTGISAADRARTIEVAIDPTSTPQDIIMPGHIFPLRARDGGVLVRPGHTEGSVDLARLAGRGAAGVICEILNNDGSMARLPQLYQFAKQHQLNIVSINDLIAYRMRHESLVEEVSSARLPIDDLGEFTMKVFTCVVDDHEHVLIQSGAIDPDIPTLVRVHSECITGDVFGSSRCDCGWQLNASLQQIAESGGVLLYLRGHEGRGIGLTNKLKAYQLQDQGLDTVEANHQLGFAADQRDYGIAAQILRHLGIQQMRLLTNNPQKIHSLKGYGIKIVSREPLEMPATETNHQYLTTKREKLGHLLELKVIPHRALLDKQTSTQ